MKKLLGMHKDEVRELVILPNLQPGEDLVGFFLAQSGPSPFVAALFGLLVHLLIKQYYVAVTDKGLHLHKLNFFGKPSGIEYFDYSEIDGVEIKKGFMQTPVKVRFTNGRKITLRGNKKGLERAAKLDDSTLDFLQTKFL